MKDKVKIVILAAGKGTRMGGDLPKVLSQVKGKSMIKRLMESVDKSGVDDCTVVIVGYKKELVIQELSNLKYNYLTQEEQLGTGHAVMMAKDYLQDKAQHIIVLYGDQPFTSAETIKKLSQRHLESGKKITMVVIDKLSDFEDWRISFKNFSKIVRDENGKIIKDE